MTTERPVIVWFRRDLRLSDNPALHHALATGRPVIAVYVLDEASAQAPLGSAGAWWLDKSLRALDSDLQARGLRLVLRRGDSEAEIRRLIDETGADSVFLNRLFEPDGFTRDADIAHGLKADGVDCRGFNATLMATPGTVLNGLGLTYKVFTPFMKALLATSEAPDPLPAPDRIHGLNGVASEAVDDWSLHPRRPDWSTGFVGAPGEAGAEAALKAFIEIGLAHYAHGRDFPAQKAVSGLSPHLHWGEISPWRAANAARAAGGDAEKFVAELVWRDFSAHLLHHFPYMIERAFRPEYDAMPWRDDDAGFNAWATGRTGYPLVDAGMRELWATGVMHNRVRMVVASFLVKHLLIDWRRGEAWFRDTLTDADLASNVQNWQWVAGCGADAAPYFRIFNPTTQAEKFDPDGRYIRRWVPEIAALSDRLIHAPWTAPSEILTAAKVRLGHDYPRPIVDHVKARERALAALKSLSGETE